MHLEQQLNREFKMKLNEDHTIRCVDVKEVARGAARAVAGGVELTEVAWRQAHSHRARGDETIVQREANGLKLLDHLRELMCIVRHSEGQGRNLRKSPRLI